MVYFFFFSHQPPSTSINMYVVDGHGRKKRHVVGLAPVSGMCNSLNSCTISEGTSFQTVLVAGHELGHRYVTFLTTTISLNAIYCIKFCLSSTHSHIVANMKKTLAGNFLSFSFATLAWVSSTMARKTATRAIKTFTLCHQHSVLEKRRGLHAVVIIWINSCAQLRPIVF